MINSTLKLGVTLASILLGATNVSAYQSKIDGSRDLTVETSGPHAHHSARRRPTRAVQVSLMPIGSSTITIGQPLRFKMVSLADGFGHLYVLSASGRTQLWLENIRIHAGRPIGYPTSGKIVRAAAPAGDETVIFVASRKPIDGFAGVGSTLTPVDLQLSHEGFRAAIEQKFNGISRENWAFAEIRVRVRD